MKHKHHIIPKHMGGTDDPSNLIELTIEEHAEAHKALWEQHNKWQDYIAWQALLKIIPSKEVHSQATKRGMKEWWNNLTEQEKQNYKNKCAKKPEGYIYKGHTYTHTEEAKKKIGAFHRGKILSEETKYKISNRKNKAYGNKNAMANLEYRKKVSLSKIGRKKVYMPDGSFKYIKPKEGLVNGD